MIKKLMNIPGTQVLDNKKLMNVIGGVDKEEYCRTLLMILLNNDLDAGAKEGARIGAEKAGC